MTRSLAACEGALLLVDASQGVEAQTLANAYLAVDEQPRDHPGHQQDRPAERAAGRMQAPDRGDHRPRRLQRASSPARRKAPASREILEAIVDRLPPPTGDPDAPLKALIFDSWYDAYRGVVIVVRVIDGTLRPKMKIRLMADGPGLRGRPARRVLAEGGPGRRARRRRGRLHRRQHQEGGRRQDRRHDHRSRCGRRWSLSRLQGTEADGVRRAVSGREPSSTPSCARRSRSCG